VGDCVLPRRRLTLEAAPIKVGAMVAKATIASPSPHVLWLDIVALPALIIVMVDLRSVRLDRVDRRYFCHVNFPLMC
jgi:hypothetical protein